MKQTLISVVVAAAVSIIVLYLEDVLDDDERGDRDDELAAAVGEHDVVQDELLPANLSYTTELVEDAWVNGARTTGADNKPLTQASNSICFLTTVEMKGIRGPQDANSCTIAVDDFTGFWEIIATVDEGGQSEVRCNARCLVWE